MDAALLQPNGKLSVASLTQLTNILPELSQSNPAISCNIIMFLAPRIIELQKIIDPNNQYELDRTRALQPEDVRALSVRLFNTVKAKGLLTLDNNQLKAFAKILEDLERDLGKVAENFLVLPTNTVVDGKIIQTANGVFVKLREGDGTFSIFDLVNSTYVGKPGQFTSPPSIITNASGDKIALGLTAGNSQPFFYNLTRGCIELQVSSRSKAREPSRELFKKYATLSSGIISVASDDKKINLIYIIEDGRVLSFPHKNSYEIEFVSKSTSGKYFFLTTDKAAGSKALVRVNSANEEIQVVRNIALPKGTYSVSNIVERPNVDYPKKTDTFVALHYRTSDGTGLMTGAYRFEDELSKRQIKPIEKEDACPLSLGGIIHKPAANKNLVLIGVPGLSGRHEIPNSEKLEIKEVLPAVGEKFGDYVFCLPTDKNFKGNYCHIIDVKTGEVILDSDGKRRKFKLFDNGKPYQLDKSGKPWVAGIEFSKNQYFITSLVPLANPGFVGIDDFRIPVKHELDIISSYGTNGIQTASIFDRHSHSLETYRRGNAVNLNVKSSTHMSVSKTFVNPHDGRILVCKDDGSDFKVFYIGDSEANAFVLPKQGSVDYPRLTDVVFSPDGETALLRVDNGSGYNKFFNFKTGAEVQGIDDRIKTASSTNVTFITDKMVLLTTTREGISQTVELA